MSNAYTFLVNDFAVNSVLTVGPPHFVSSHDAYDFESALSSGSTIILIHSHKLCHNIVIILYLFQVIAVDNAAPPRTGTATISVTVTDVNDNDPIITNPSGRSITINTVSFHCSCLHLISV